MTFPSSAVTTLEDALHNLRDVAAGVKNMSTNIRAQSLTGTLTYPVIMNYMAGLRAAKTRMAVYAGVTGLGAYAQAQIGNGGTFIADYNAMVSAIDAAVAWVATNLPKDGNNYALAIQIAANGVATDRTFTSGALSGFRTQIDLLTATIS